MSGGAVAESPNQFEVYWQKTLSHRFRFTFESWCAAFVGDDALLIRRNIYRECSRNDINPDVWAEFLTDIISFRELVSEPYRLIKSVLRGPHQKMFALPGQEVAWGGDVCHFERLDRFVGFGLRLPLGGDRLLQRIAELIQAGKCTGDDIEGKRLGREGRPFWITDDALSGETSSDRVRDRLGLRSLVQSGYRLVEVRYSAAYLAEKGVPIKAPTVLDAWQDGPEGSWIFTKKSEEGGGPTPGRTVDISEAYGKLGVPEAVHASVGVSIGEGRQIGLRVLDATTGPPQEMSLVGLLRNQEI